MNIATRKNVLLVEDERAIRSLVADVLNEANLRVIEAELGEKALAILKKPYGRKKLLQFVAQNL
jgi:DNA-binding response OmpR family regulator